MSEPREIIESVTCGVCGHYFGLVTSDGAGPIFDECVAERKTQREKCPMHARLAKYQPKVVPLNLAGKGNGFSLPDEDSGGYASVARRAMEDG